MPKDVTRFEFAPRRSCVTSLREVAHIRRHQLFTQLPQLKSRGSMLRVDAGPSNDDKNMTVDSSQSDFNSEANLDAVMDSSECNVLPRDLNAGKTD